MTDTQMIERPETGTDLAIMGGAVTALTVFGTDGGVDAILKRIAAQARAVDTDISTPAGRKAVASLAYKIARSKTALDAMGRDLGEQNYRAWKAITSERSRIGKALDELAADIRRPLTEYENAERARAAAHEAAIDTLVEGPLFYAADNSAEDLAKRLRYLESFPPRDWQEFAKRAADALASEIAKTNVALVEAVRREADAEAAEKAARDELDRQAEALARRAAEQKAADDLAAEAERARIAQRRAEVAEAARIEVERKAKADAEKAALAAELGRALAIEEAIDAERKRIAGAQAKEASETAAREANTRHRAKINNDVLDDLVAVTEITSAAARAVITAIVSGRVRHARISY